MHHKMTVMLAVVLLYVTAWAVPDASVQQPVTVSVDGEASGPARNERLLSDIPPGYQPRPAPEPTQGEPPQLLEVAGGEDGGEPAGPKPLWGPDATVFSGNIKYITPLQSERMIAYDQTEDGILFAGFTVPNGDTAWIYRSTDGGNSWAQWNGLYGPSSVWTSLELVVAEGDSDFVFFFAKRSTGSGDIYVGRWAINGSTANLFNVKVDSDTIANLSACRDRENHYYLYVACDRRSGDYDLVQLRSTDYGKTWGAMGNGNIVTTGTRTAPDVCYGRNGHVYTVCRDSVRSSSSNVSFRFKHSPDRGDTWLESVEVGSPAVPLADPVVGAARSSNIIWLVHARDLGGARSWDIYYYASVDSGDNWTLRSISNADSAAEQMPSIACSPDSGYATLCYTVTPGESIMFTWASDDTNWTTPERVSDNRATGFFPPQAGWKNGDGYSTVLYGGYTALGLYFDAWSMSGMEEGRPVTGEPAVLAARPSPARDRTVISYSLPGSSHARVSVSDIAGRQVAVLAQGTLAAGAHSAVWDCANVPAGVYLVRIETGTGSQTGRLVVSH